MPVTSWVLGDVGYCAGDVLDVVHIRLILLVCLLLCDTMMDRNRLRMG